MTDWDRDPFDEQATLVVQACVWWRETSADQTIRPQMGQPRRQAIVVTSVALFLALVFLYTFQKQAGSDAQSYQNVPIHEVDVTSETMHGDVIMPKLGNETLK